MLLLNTDIKYKIKHKIILKMLNLSKFTCREFVVLAAVLVCPV